MDEGWIFDSSSRAELLGLIVERVAIQGATAPWVIEPKCPITKVSLMYAVKVLWSVVQARLRPIGNNNILQPSHAFLIACLMSRYKENMG